jgi:outer membrane receptor protein involved in Fe transport
VNRQVNPSVVFIFAIVLSGLLNLTATNAIGQQATVKGTITDATTGESVPGVSVMADSVRGTASDLNGNYQLRLSPGKYTITYTYIGYRPEYAEFELQAGQVVQHDISLKSSAIELNTAVVSASRYEQRLSDVTVSMEVIPAKFIESVNTRQLDETVGLMPGVDVLDGQANIRGGSGYSYGAGSRVLLLVDDLPMLSGGVDDIKWNALPLENIDQVEILKGASSALYGSSALNGVINLRTADPGPKPSTYVEASAGIFMRPARDELTWWWDHDPLFGDVRFSHMRKAGPLDITFGGAGLYDEGYRQDNYQRYGRLNAAIKYNPKEHRGISVGFNTNLQYQAFSDFLLWQDADSGAFIQNPDAVSHNEGMRFNIDPYFLYYDMKDGRQSLRTRYFRVMNDFPDTPDKNNNSDYFFGEYQYQKKFKNDLHLSAGAAGSYTIGNSNLYGDHTGSTMALYAQADYKFFKKLSTSLGMRWEYYSMDRTDNGSRPVVRAGVSYEAAKYTFIRASFGQGYRYPSMAEKYTATSLGALKIFPNPELQPETGWSTELGIKQGFRLGQWTGFFDLAGFWSQYQDMIEFTFGIYKPDSVPYPTLDDIGFMSLNVGNTRISGVDVSVNGQGRAGEFLFSYFAGYTYMDPVDLSPDTSGQQMLKYRYHHSVKADFAVDWRKWDAGFTLVYTSFMERIDPAFEESILGQEILPGMKEYRAEHDHGSVVVDLRFGWQCTKTSRISFFVKNLFNVEYMGRPGDIQPPLSFSLQYILKI